MNGQLQKENLVAYRWSPLRFKKLHKAKKEELKARLSIYTLV